MLNQRSIDRLKGVKPILISILIEAAKDSPVPFQIPQDGGVRTDARQYELFKKGASKKDGITKKSNHQPKADGFGWAADFVATHSKDIKEMYNPAKLEAIARHIQKVALEKFQTKVYWGGDWDNDGLTAAQGDKDEKFIDYPHLELRN